MTWSHVACIAVGILVQAATFALGLLVGVALRKEPDHGGQGTDSWWRQIERRRVEECIAGGRKGCVGPCRKAGAGERQDR